MKYSQEDLDRASGTAQRKYAEAYNRLGGVNAVARKFGVNVSSVSRSLKSLDLRVANRIPSMMRLGKVTHQFREENGDVRWVRQHPDEQTFETIVEYAEEKTANLKGRLPPIKKPKPGDPDRLAVYKAPDLHIGMCAWAEQSGDDFDLKIARRVYRSTFDSLVSRTPQTKTALMLVPGDGTHSNTQAATTAKGTKVDVDTRFPRVAAETLGFYQYSADRMLEKHEKVVYKILAGNHDEDLAIMMAIAMAALYSREPRMQVSLDPAYFWRYRFGKCLLATTHGHTIKGQINKSLAEIMAADWPEDWGATKHRHWYLGHVHHLTEDERRGCTIETLRTIAPKDLWHYNAGYRSGRELKCDVWDKDDGRTDTFREPARDQESRK